MGKRGGSTGQPFPTLTPSQPDPETRGGWLLPTIAGGVAVAAVFAVIASRRSPGLPPSPPSNLLDKRTFDELDVEAGARMLASENPRGSEALKREQLYTQIAQAKRHKQSLYDRITAGADYGPQNRRRPVSTDNRATDLDRQLVRRVLEGQAPGPTLPTARKFFEPAVQNMAFAVAQGARAKQKRGEALTAQEQRLLGYEQDADGIRRDWKSEGAKPLGTIEGVEFWT